MTRRSSATSGAWRLASAAMTAAPAYRPTSPRRRTTSASRAISKSRRPRPRPRRRRRPMRRPAPRWRPKARRRSKPKRPPSPTIWMSFPSRSTWTETARPPPHRVRSPTKWRRRRHPSRSPESCRPRQPVSTPAGNSPTRPTTRSRRSATRSCSRSARTTSRPPAPPPRMRSPEDQRFATPWEELAAAYEGLPAEDTDDRWVYLRKIAEVWERGQHDVDRALDALGRAFRLDITDTEIRAELERIGEQYNRWERIAEIYLGSIDEFGPIEAAVTLHHDAALVRERLGQIGPAEELYRSILRLKSDDAKAIQRVEEICRDQQRWEDLANVLEQRTGAPTEAMPHGLERRRRLRELAALYEERLERPYEAIDTLERLLRESSEEERGTREPTDSADSADSPSAEETLGAY